MHTKRAIPLLLILLSGFSSLVFQLLWMRQLGLLFGNTAHAAAMTLAVFFAGLAAGSWFWGRRSRTVRSPMLAFAWLEVGIAVTALLYFAVLAIFYAVYPAFYQGIAAPSLLWIVKFLLAVLLILPPSFCMGGTIPMLGQAVIRDRHAFGIRAARLYAVNTIGAALGALATGFLLVRLIGFTWTCVAAIGLTGAIAASAYFLARQPEAEQAHKVPKLPGNVPPRSRGAIIAVYAVCFLSGFGFLALEVLWTILLAQIHTNSVYSFSAVLVMILLSLALGAAAASRLARLRVRPLLVLVSLLTLGGLAVTVSPFLFMNGAGDLVMLETSGTFGQFMQDLFGKGALLLGLPAFCLAMIFPFLMKVEEAYISQPGITLGRLSAVNTAGAIAGALCSGFVFIELLGMWRTMQALAALYLLAALLMPTGRSRYAHAVRAVAVIALLSLFTWLRPVNLPVTARNPARPPQELIELWETSGGTVSVVQDEYSGLVIKMNSNYWLGSTGAAFQQHFQGRIPLLIYPDTKSIFFLGMGTGISVGGALDPRFEQVERVVACELVPEVVEAAQKYMTGDFALSGLRSVDFTSGVFRDDRVEVLVEDGRHYLMASGETFDMINADLFLPYRRGAGSLYSREHFQNVGKSLNPGGVFVQWLPMYQISDFEFGVIARTMLEAFEQVTMWRNSFRPGQEAAALIGHKTATPLPAAPSEQSDARIADVAGKNPLRIDRLDLTYTEENVLVFYCGNLTQSKDLFQDYPLNTDDRPVIEHAAPFSIRKKQDGFAATLVGPRFAELVDRILTRCPPDTDPMLANRSEADKRMVQAGVALYRFWLAKAMGENRQAVSAWNQFVREWTNQPPAAR